MVKAPHSFGDQRIRRFQREGSDQEMPKRGGGGGRDPEGFFGLSLILHTLLSLVSGVGGLG